MSYLSAAVLYILNFNEEILMPMRLLLGAVHLAAQITILLTFEQNVMAAFPLTGKANPHYEEALRMTTFIVSFGLISLFVNMAGCVLGFSFSSTPLNFLSNAAHLGAILSLFHIWKENIHYVRIWHQFYFFQFVPGVLELGNMLLVVRQRQRYVF